MTGDAADLTMDPIVNLRDAHLIELYLQRASADRDGHLDTYPESRTVDATFQVDALRSPGSQP